MVARVSIQCSAFLVMAVILLAGCTGTVPPSGPAQPIAKDISFRIPSVDTLASDFDASQIVVGSWNGRTFNFEVHLHKERNRVVVAAVDPLGNGVLNYIWTDHDVVVGYAADWLSGPLSPQSLVAHLALIYWPMSAVGEGLLGTGIAVEDTQYQRVLKKDGKAVITVTYAPDRRSAWNGQSQVQHSEFDYKIFVTSAVKK